MEPAVLVAIAVIGAAAAAVIVGRRKPQAPTQPTYSAPAQLDRADFDSPTAPWLLAVFTSATCDSCAAVKDKAKVLASADVAVQEIEVSARKDLHDRYAIDAVPTIVLADAEGVVQATFIGPPSATDLWAAVAEAREGRKFGENTDR